MKRRKDLLVNGAALYGAQTALASAGIVYINDSPIVASFSTAGSFNWDIDGSGGNEASVTAFGGGSGVSMTWSGLNLSGFVQKGGGGADIQRLSAGFTIGAALATGYNFGSTGTTAGLIGTGNVLGNNLKGFSGDPAQGFVGFRFKNGSDTHYGWAQFSADFTAGTFTISEWAYDDTAGASIQAGLTAVPEPAETGLALGFLALGAAGLRRWRRQRAAAA